MRGIARTILLGNLTRDPELKHTAGGVAVATFGVAVNGREKDSSGEWVDRADFFDVVAFGHTAEACDQYLAKGRPVGVDGRLRQDRWQDKETGKNRSRVEVIADTVEFLPAGNGGPNSDADPPSPAEQPDLTPEDEIPF